MKGLVKLDHKSVVAAKYLALLISHTIQVLLYQTDNLFASGIKNYQLYQYTAEQNTTSRYPDRNLVEGSSWYLPTLTSQLTIHRLWQSTSVKKYHVEECGQFTKAGDQKVCI